MATHNIAQNLRDNNTNWQNVKQAIEDKGVSTYGLTTAQYANAISQIPSGSEPVLETLNVTPSTVSQTITPPSGVDGYDEVNVDAVELQSKTITPSASQQVVTPDTGYLGLSQVTVEASGGGNYQSKTVTPSASQQTVTPDSGYDALSQVVVGAATLQNKTISPSTSQQTVSADSHNYGLGTVTVDAVALQSKTVTQSASQQVVTPDSGYLGLSQVTVDAASGGGNVGYSTPKNKEAGYIKDYRKISTVTSVDNRIAILFKGVVHVFNDDIHWTYDDTTETLVNQETVSELSGNQTWHRMPVVDDSGDYMYLLSKPNWSGNSQLVKYDGTTFTVVGSRDISAGGLLYDNGYILVDRGSTYIKVDVTDGTHTEISKDNSLSFRYAFKYNGTFYTSNATNYIYEMDIANDTKTQILELPGSQFKNTFFVDETTGWIYTIQGPQQNETLVRFKVTGEIETIGTSYNIGRNYGGELICTFILNDVVYVLWYNMEQVATYDVARTVVAVPTSATRIYNGCTSADVNETTSGDYSILEIPAEANYMIYDSNNIYGYNVVSNKILVASGMKINGTTQSAGLVDVSSLSYYLVEM